MVVLVERAIETSAWVLGPDGTSSATSRRLDSERWRANV